jgi:drug/metabolite transporter (DMT)-like permease
MKDRLANWSLLLLLSVIWGSSFILMKKGMYNALDMPVFSSIQVGAIRMLIAGSLMLPLGIIHLLKVKSRKDLFFLSVVGLCGNFFPAFLFTYAETGISSGLAGILNSSTPLFTVVLGTLIFRMRFSAVQLSGVLIGSLGVFILLSKSIEGQSNATWLHPTAVVMATFFYAISLNTIKHKLQHLRSIQITASALSMVWLPALIVFFLFETPITISSHPDAYNSLLSIGILSIIGTVAAVLIFNVLIRRSTAIFASSVTYLIPAVAIIIGSIFGEQFHWTQPIALLIILVGIFRANTPVREQS